MKKYRATLFHPEGDYVTDFRRDTIQEVWEEVADMGSKWFFYPIVFVTTDKTIVDTTEDAPKSWKGKRIATIQKKLANHWAINKDEICEWINAGMPLWHVY